jgi:hypothetical protein
MKRYGDYEVVVNPALRRPSALRSMLSVLLSSKRDRGGAAIKLAHPYNPGGEPEKTS